jgi:uncharacterized protein (TIGR03000 family)
VVLTAPPAPFILLYQKPQDLRFPGRQGPHDRIAPEGDAEMYSLVLMSAMTTAPDAAGNGFFRDLFSFRGGCYGCCGGARYSCLGDCHGSCYGCCGGWFLGFFSARRSDPYGCGGCFGRSSGCSGVSHACFGGAAYSCFGAPVAYTPVFNGGLTCHGGPIPSAPPPAFESAPVYPGSPGVPNIPFAPPEPAPPAVVPERSGLRPAGGSWNPALTTSNGSGERATVVVRLPADARLYADGSALRMTGAERKFVTPELPAGYEFTYRLTAEYEREGETISVSKKVAVRAGGSAVVEFADLVAGRPTGGKATPASGEKDRAPAATPVSNPAPAAPASNSAPTSSIPPGAPVTPITGAPPPSALDRATITVVLPPGAALYVDDRKSPSAAPVRQFTTPPLPAGREFAYLMKAEVIRDGRPEYLIQKVPFRAGERLTVDFSNLGR